MLQTIANTICFGEFKLSSGKTSNYYFDLRKLFSYPHILQKLVNTFDHNENQLICGVPYGAIPLATAYSLEHKCKQIVLRKEPKKYGCKQLIEGEYTIGDHVILIDDVYTTGSSINKAKEQLESSGLIVSKLIVIVYRGEEPGPSNLNYLFTEKELLCTHIVYLKRHLHMKGNLCFAADLPTMDDIINKINKLKDISVVKIHPELINDFNINKLLDLKKSKGFLLWADIKICEVPHIALKQLELCSWADIVSVMSIVGIKTLNDLQIRATDLNIMLVLVSNGKQYRYI